MNNIGLGIQLNTLHRNFGGTHSSLIALFSLFETLHNFQSLVNASEGEISDRWAIGWYENLLKTSERGELHFNPEIKRYIKKWHISERKWEKILDEARKEYFILFQQRGIKDTIEKLLEKAKYGRLFSSLK